MFYDRIDEEDARVVDTAQLDSGCPLIPQGNLKIKTESSFVFLIEDWRRCTVLHLHVFAVLQ